KDPGVNKGTDSSLKIRSKSGEALRALVAFDLPTVPVGCKVGTAALRVDAASAVEGRTLQALALAAPWIENQVSWSTQPATTGGGATTVSGTGWREWVVTAQVSGMYAAGVEHGFLIRDANETQDAEQSFRSREDGVASSPQLVLTFAPAD
ncbi:MAG: DNRLRE domain-containing protein, partial [Microbacterium sp.]